MKNHVLVLLNSASPDCHQAREWVLPYLEHFGVPCEILDLRRQPLPRAVDEYPLILLAHPGLDDALSFIEFGTGSGHSDRAGVRLGGSDLGRLRDAIRAGSGLVSFDPQLSCWLAGEKPGGSRLPAITEIEIHGGDHYITLNHPADERIGLVSELELARVPAPSLRSGQALSAANGPAGATLAGSGSQALLTANTLERGRMLHWASAAWMHSGILGPLAGLDDLFWRGLVWAARKPFCLRGLPPLVTMRVDDVAGWGGLWEQPPLYWLEDACKLGFKPWLGLFIYNLPGETVNQLRPYLQNGRATAFPHAFGRPNREPADRYFYYENALPLRADAYDEFIYFNHQQAEAWPDAEAARGMQAVDDWYAAHAPLPLSPCAIPHWGEIGSNVIEHVHDRWDADLLVTYHGIDAPLEGSRWLVGGPFRKYEVPGSALFDRNDRGDRPVYYADFQNFAGKQFFHCFSEVRNDTGYEWAPDNDVETTARRGLSQLKRALDSMALPTLFTHETDYVYKIRPENWREILKRIAQGLAAYQPQQVTLDDGMRAVRATKTSSFSECFYEPETGEIQAVFNGYSDMPTSFYLFTEAGQEIASRMVRVPVFQKRKVVRYQVKE